MRFRRPRQREHGVLNRWVDSETVDNICFYATFAVFVMLQVIWFRLALASIRIEVQKLPLSHDQLKEWMVKRGQLSKKASESVPPVFKISSDVVVKFF